MPIELDPEALTESAEWRARGVKPLRPQGPQNNGTRGAHAFESRADGSLLIYATLPNGDGEPIHIEPHRVGAVLAACGDALARKSSSH